jgi:hypothetical protein
MQNNKTVKSQILDKYMSKDKVRKKNQSRKKIQVKMRERINK